MSPSEYQLDLRHWDFERIELLSLKTVTTESHLDISVQGDEDNENTGRAVVLEVRDNGTLAVLCYPRDRDDPVTILLPVDGGVWFDNEPGVEAA